MKLEKKHLPLAARLHPLASVTAVTVTTAAFAKAFVPFYLIGSTPIFAGTALFGLVLVILDWREIRENAVYATDILVALSLLYGVVAANYLANSLEQVPITHLLGIMLFHSVFLAFGFAAARAPVPVYIVLLAQAAIYVIAIAQYTFRFGDLMRNGFLQNVFGVGLPELVTTFHQNIGTALGLALLAALGFDSRWIRLSALAALPFVVVFMFYIASRTAMVSLLGGLLFLAWASLWVRSRKVALVSLLTLFVTGAVASGFLYSFALQDNTHVNAAAPDAISRTIREIQSHDPGFRMEIWARAWHRIETQPNRLPFGHGIGSYSIDEGFSAPTWLIERSPKHYPHNAHLELLYETGVIGLLIFGFITLFPIFVALKYWSELSTPERAAISLYVFYLLSIDVSGSFAYSYDFQFFLALAVGVLALKRKQLAKATAPPPSYLDSEVTARKQVS
jgi:O-antigen ligase